MTELIHAARALISNWATAPAWYAAAPTQVILTHNIRPIWTRARTWALGRRIEPTRHGHFITWALGHQRRRRYVRTYWTNQDPGAKTRVAHGRESRHGHEASHETRGPAPEITSPVGGAADQADRRPRLLSAAAPHTP